MARPKATDPFDAKLETWVPPRYADAVELLAKKQLLSSSDIVRQGVIMVLNQFGALPAAPRPNGHEQHQQGAAENALV